MANRIAATTSFIGRIVPIVAKSDPDNNENMGNRSLNRARQLDFDFLPEFSTSTKSLLYRQKNTTKYLLLAHLSQVYQGYLALNFEDRLPCRIPGLFHPIRRFAFSLDSENPIV